MRLKYLAFCQRKWTFLAKSSAKISFDYPDVTGVLNIFHWIPGFTIDSPSNESLRLAQVCASIPDCAVVSVRRSHNDYFNKYLMKKAVLSIHYAETNANEFIRAPASTGDEYSLFTAEGRTRGGCMNMETPNPSCKCTRAHLQTCVHQTDFGVILCCFPKIFFLNVFTIAARPKRQLLGGEAATWRRCRTRGRECALCAFVSVWLLCTRKEVRALPYSIWYKAPAPIMYAGSTGIDTVQSWEIRSGSSNKKHTHFSIENVSFWLIVFSNFIKSLLFPFTAFLVLEVLVFDRWPAPKNCQHLLEWRTKRRRILGVRSGSLRQLFLVLFVWTQARRDITWWVWKTGSCQTLLAVQRTVGKSPPLVRHGQ